MNNFSSNNLSFIYKRFTLAGCTAVGNRQFEFVAKNQSFVLKQRRFVFLSANWQELTFMKMAEILCEDYFLWLHLFYQHFILF